MEQGGSHISKGGRVVEPSDFGLTTRTGHRSIGRPPARYVEADDIVEAVGKNWMRLTSNRPRWRANKEALVQQWTEIG
ncbi:jg2364 [Pararge aegeria aegeria]|uniref:Jg2364 protein n=1 Tax=Pararge aegeria aegeria TaxID=348720 RepID=A0A8S4SB05_9NEOP|nr:jg2364 [Pararge aegeria aegeria]